jgi:hypothetical protein
VNEIHEFGFWQLNYKRGIATESCRSAYRLGGFNVSDLMGITWRMIDIGKKITFYFLQNV